MLINILILYTYVFICLCVYGGIRICILTIHRGSMVCYPHCISVIIAGAGTNGGETGCLPKDGHIKQKSHIGEMWEDKRWEHARTASDGCTSPIFSRWLTVFWLQLLEADPRLWKWSLIPRLFNVETALAMVGSIDRDISRFTIVSYYTHTVILSIESSDWRVWWEWWVCFTVGNEWSGDMFCRKNLCAQTQAHSVVCSKQCTTRLEWSSLWRTQWLMLSGIVLDTHDLVMNGSMGFHV